MADGTGNTQLRDVDEVAGAPVGKCEANIRHDPRQVVAFGAKGIRAGTSSTGAEIGVRKDILNRRARSCTDCDLAELVSAFQNVAVLRAMGAVGSGAAEFPIVVAVVAIRTEDSGAGT